MIWSTQSGDVRDWQTLRRLLRTHSLVTTRLPLEDGRVIEIRKSSLPGPEIDHDHEVRPE